MSEIKLWVVGLFEMFYYLETILKDRLRTALSQINPEVPLICIEGSFKLHVILLPKFLSGEISVPDAEKLAKDLK